MYAADGNGNATAAAAAKAGEQLLPLFDFALSVVYGLLSGMSSHAWRRQWHRGSRWGLLADF